VSDFEPKETLDVVMPVRFSTATRMEIAEVAEELGIPDSRLVRAAVKEWLANRKT
jgi:hypothetical protein